MRNEEIKPKGRRPYDGVKKKSLVFLRDHGLFEVLGLESNGNLGVEGGELSLSCGGPESKSRNPVGLGLE